MGCHAIGGQSKRQHPIKLCITGVSTPQRKAKLLAKNVQIAVSNPRTKGVMNNHLTFSFASQLAQMLEPGLPSPQKRQGDQSGGRLYGEGAGLTRLLGLCGAPPCCTALLGGAAQHGLAVPPGVCGLASTSRLRESWRHVGQGESPARPPRGQSFGAIGLHADRQAPATTERVLRTRGWEKDLAQGAVPLAGFLI